MSNDISRESEFELAADQQRRIAEIGRIVTASTDLNTVFSEFAEQAKNLVPFDRLAISTVDPETQFITDALITGLETSEINYSGPHTLEDSALPSDVYENHQVSIANASTMALLTETDVAADNSVRIAAGLLSAMFTPIVLQGTLVGTLVFRSKQEDPYGEAEADLASQIAAQIAGVISTNQQLALLEQASEQHRRLVFEQSQLAEIGRIVGSTFDFNEVLSRFAQQAKLLVQHDRLVISSWSEDGKTLIDQHVAGIEIEGHEIGKEVVVAQDHVWQRLYNEKMPWVANGDDYIDQIDHDNREQPRFTSGLRSVMIVPLLWQGKISGSMAFRSKNPEAFSEHEVGLAIDIAAQISGSIASADQFKLLEQQSAERERLALESAKIAAIGRLVSSSLNIGEVLSSLADQVRELVPFDRLVISLLDEEHTTIKDVVIDGLLIDDGQPDNIHPLAGDFKDSLIKANTPLVANGADFRDLADQYLSEATRYEAGLRSVLTVPLAWQSAVVGTLTFRSEEISPYGERQLGIAQQIAAQIAGAIATSNQYAQLQIESTERARLADEQRRIAELGRTVSSTLDLDEIYSSFAEHARKLVPSDRFVIMIVDEDRKSTIDAFIEGEVRTNRKVGDTTEIVPDTFLAEIVAGGIPKIIRDDDYAEHARGNEKEKRRYSIGLRSVLAAPIVWEGRTIGVTVFRSGDPQAYGDREKELSRQICAQIAGAVAGAYQYQQLQAESAERERLAFELAKISEIGRIVSSTLDFKEVLSRFAQEAKYLVPHDRMVISSWSEDGSTLVEQYIEGIDIDGNVSGIVREVPKNETRQRLYVEQLPWVVRGDEYAAAKDEHEEEQSRYDSGLRSMLVVPLLWQGKNSGAISFRSKDPNSFEDSQVQLAVAIAAQVSGAVATASQYRQIEEQSTERQRLADEQARIAEIGRIVSSTLDIEDVLVAFVEQARLLVPFDRIVITVANDDLTEVTDVLVDGILVDTESIGASHLFSANTVQERLILTQERIVANGEEYERHVRENRVELTRYDSGLRSLMMIPLVWQGRSFGSLNLRSVDPHAYGERQVELAEQIAAQIAGAIATSKQFRSLESALDNVRLQAAALEAAEDAIIIRNPDLTVVYVNRGFEKQTGFTKEEVVGATFDNIEQAETEDGTFDGVWDDLRSGKTWRRTFPLKRKDGTRYIVDATLTPVFDDDGNIDVFLGVRRDVTEQVKADELNRTQAAALEAADDAIVIRNDDTTVVYVNSGFERQTGFSRDEVVGTNFNYPENFSSTPQSLIDLYATVRQGNTWRKIVTSIRKDGSEYTVDATLNPIFNEDGEFDKYVGVRRDVTEQVKADEANKTLAAALEAADDAMMILNIDTSTEWVNEAFVRDTGYSKEEAVGQRSPFLRSDKNSPETFDGLWEQVRTGQPWMGRIWTRRKDGSEYLSDVSLSPVFGDDGLIAKFVGMRRDMTSVIQAEQDREARRDLDAQNNQLLELNVQREEFFSTVSHELRTPLTSVMAFADILSRDRDNNLTDLQKDHLDVIKRNSRNLNELVEDMLDFSRMSNQHLKLEKSEFEFHSLLDSVVESMEPTAAERGQTLTIGSHTEPVWIVADHGRIVQIISNLITNSCKYSPTGTRITINVRSKLGQVSVTVSDEGVGIPATDLDSIYSPFFRSNQLEVREQIGTGLGLAISKTLVELHDGTIDAKSVIDVGTDITVTLPGASSTPTVNAKA